MTSGLQQFEFEIVSVDRQGEIIERSIQSAQQVAEDLGNGVILEMVAIQGGMFRMGSRESQGYADEHPQHSVRVAAFGWRSIRLRKNSGQPSWTGRHPTAAAALARPVDRVSWTIPGGFVSGLRP